MVLYSVQFKLSMLNMLLFSENIFKNTQSFRLQFLVLSYLNKYLALKVVIQFARPLTAQKLTNQIV